MKVKIIIALVLLSVGPLYITVTDHLEEKKREEISRVKNYVRGSVSHVITNETKIPESLVYDDKKIDLDFTINQNLQKRLPKKKRNPLLRHSRRQSHGNQKPHRRNRPQKRLHRNTSQKRYHTRMHQLR